MTAAIVVPVLFIVGCKNPRHGFLSDNNKGNVIGIQVLGEFDPAQLRFVSNQVGQFFNRPVIVLPVKMIPIQFLNTEKGERYSADSIIQLLS